MARALGLSLGCGVRRALSPPPGGCSAVGEGALCMDGRRPPGLPLLMPGARRLVRAALFPAREAVSAAVRAPSLPPRLLSPSLRDSVCASAPPLPGCACRLSAPPPPQDARRARPRAALAAGRAESVGRDGGGGRGRGAGARASPRTSETPRRRGEAETRGEGVESRRRGQGFGAGAPRWDWGDRGRDREGGFGDLAGGVRSLRATHAGCTAGPLLAHLPT